jgi:cytochrome c peroxidase
MTFPSVRGTCGSKRYLLNNAGSSGLEEFIKMYRAVRYYTLTTVFTAFVLTGCGGGDEVLPNSNVNTVNAGIINENDLDAALASVILTKKLSGDPSLNRNLPDITEPLPQLGKLLFFSKALGGDKDAACVTCHHPMLGGGDDLPLAIGVAAVNPNQLGPERLHDPFALNWDGGPTMPRNVPTVFNVGMLDKAMFWDGRLNSLGRTPGMNGADGSGIRTPDSPLDVADPNAGDTLPEAIARFPVLVHEEMRGFEFEAGQDNEAVRNHLAARLGNYGIGIGELPVNNWLPLFQSTFNSNEPAESLIIYSNIAKAIGEYIRSQVFVNTPWKAYSQGDSTAISDSAKRGALLFFNTIEQGGANCASCHTGDFFTDETTHVIAVPQIGRGKGNGVTEDDDFGRFNETQDQTDMYAFRTPTLLNVTATGPWGHSGAFESLESIVRHHLNVEQSVAAFDFLQISQQGVQISNAVTNTQNAVNQLLANRAANKKNVLQNVNLSDSQVNDLITFLETLTDPCVEDRKCLSPWIINDNDPNPDNLRLIAVDADGNLL